MWQIYSPHIRILASEEIDVEVASRTLCNGKRTPNTMSPGGWTLQALKLCQHFGRRRPNFRVHMPPLSEPGPKLLPLQHLEGWSDLVPHLRVQIDGQDSLFFSG